MTDTTANLDVAAHAISTAVVILKSEMPTIKAFLKEPPYGDSRSRDAHALLNPLFIAAVTFVDAHDEHVLKAKGVLGKVGK